MKRLLLKLVHHDLSEEISDFFCLFFIKFFLFVFRQHFPKVSFPRDVVAVNTVIAFCLVQTRVVALEVVLNAHEVIDLGPR